MAMLRLDKLLADEGVASRKDLREMIRAGRVTVDGAVERPLDGERVGYRRFHYYMMDKPVGVVTATEDKRQQTVLDLLPPDLKRMGLFPVGRLDKDTSGLLLLTDDGEFAHRVISPKSCVKKRYYAEVEGEADEQDALAFSRGILLRDGTQCLPAELTLLGGGKCAVTVMEGKYHQVRRMLASRGKPVLALRRVSIGGLRLPDDLGAGGVRELTEEDLCTLFKA